MPAYQTEITSYRKLFAFQKAKQLILLVYEVTRNFPREEQFALVSQMRRAAISILANLVEGYSKRSTKDYCRFLNISIGSATELQIYIDLSLDLGYIDQQKSTMMKSSLDEILKLLYSYQKILKTKK